MSQSNFGRVALGVHENVFSGAAVCLMDDGPCGRLSEPPIKSMPTTTTSPTTPTTPTSPTNPVVGTCSSTSPEFCTLSNIVGTQVAGGSPSQPYLQDNGSPLVVPTQSSSPSKMPLIMVVLVIAGAVAYFYYRKHGGEKLI
jgi:hypothetical protein